MPNRYYGVHIHEPAEDGNVPENANVTVNGSFFPPDMDMQSGEVYFEDGNGNRIGNAVAVRADTAHPNHWSATVPPPNVGADTYYLICAQIRFRNPPTQMPYPYRKHSIRVNVVYVPGTPVPPHGAAGHG